MQENFNKNRRNQNNIEKPKNLKQALTAALSPEELGHLISSFDIVGEIAIIEIPKELEKKQKIIAQALMQVQKNVKTVCKKLSGRKGRYRLQKVKVIAGKKSTETIHKESGCMFNLDITKAFFSPRLSGERQRIAKQIKEGEIVGVFFAGIGPYPIVFAKHSQMKKAFAIELNKNAVRLLKENLKLNKVTDKIEVFFGNVKKLVKKIAGKCDRIVMPMPKGGEDFLKQAFIAAKKEAIIHFYHFVERENGFSEAIERIKKACKKNRVECSILNKRRVIDFSASKIEAVIDFSIKKAKQQKFK